MEEIYGNAKSIDLPFENQPPFRGWESTLPTALNNWCWMGTMIWWPLGHLPFYQYQLSLNWHRPVGMLFLRAESCCFCWPVNEAVQYDLVCLDFLLICVLYRWQISVRHVFWCKYWLNIIYHDGSCKGHYMKVRNLMSFVVVVKIVTSYKH